MSEVTMGTQVSLTEAADLVEHMGPKVSFIFKGEMGIGKSHILKTLSMRPSMADRFRFVYAETQTFDVGDVSGVPFTEVERGMKVTRFAPNALLGMQSDKPIVFMADEIGKATRPVQNTMLRLFQSRKLNDNTMPEGSIIFGTTNLSSEGLGDHVQQHAQNRVSMVEVAKPSAAQWLVWSMEHGVNPIVQAWVKRIPHCLASYRDGEGNPYICYPSKTDGPCVTPRSLENASHILNERGKVSDNAVAAALRGCVGPAAAADLLTFAQTYDRLPAWEAMVRDPMGCALPSAQDFAANFVIVFSSIQMVDENTVDPFMKYLQRMPKEYQGVFALNVLTSPKRSVAMSCRPFIVWATENHYLV